jgi:phosphocarrier protein HPr
MNAAPVAKARLVIQNRLGLHARAAALFVQVASGFDASVSVQKDGETVDGKSIMGLMMLAAGKGSAIDVETAGQDAEPCLRALGDLVQAKFHEAD